MATLHSKIEQYVGRKVDFIHEVMIHSESGKEPYIGSWNVEGKPKPTDEQLKALESKAAEVDAQNALNYLRTIRDKKLTETDWVVIKEKEEGGTVKNFADWKEYRQKLRDITNTYKSLKDVKWPTAPSE